MWLVWLIVALGGTLGWSSAMLIFATIRRNKRLQWRFLVLTLVLVAALFASIEAFGPLLPLDRPGAN